MRKRTLEIGVLLGEAQGGGGYLHLLREVLGVLAVLADTEGGAVIQMQSGHS